MKHEETNKIGSFAARGTGLLYDYDAHSGVLCVSRAGNYTPVIQCRIDAELSRDPLEYIRLTEKATHIQALKFSDGATINLPETLDDARLTAIMVWALRLAHYSFNLRHEKFVPFQQQFVMDHELAHLEIRRMEGHSHMPFFIAVLRTQHGDGVSSRSSTLHGTLTYLADKMARDMIADKFGKNVDSCVHKLLNIASTLSTLSFILNERYNPKVKLKGHNGPLDNLRGQTTKNQLKTIN